MRHVYRFFFVLSLLPFLAPAAFGGTNPYCQGAKQGACWIHWGEDWLKGPTDCFDKDFQFEYGGQKYRAWTAQNPSNAPLHRLVAVQKLAPSYDEMGAAYSGDIDASSVSLDIPGFKPGKVGFFVMCIWRGDVSGTRLDFPPAGR